MSKVVVDASVAIKWVCQEEGTPEALALLGQTSLTAPDFLVVECANILWKMVKRGQLSKREALLGARILANADIELLPTRFLLERTATIAVDLDHPAYDCMYLALAEAYDWSYVTADERFARKVRESRLTEVRDVIISLSEAPTRLLGGRS